MTAPLCSRGWQAEIPMLGRPDHGSIHASTAPSAADNNTVTQSIGVFNPLVSLFPRLLQSELVTDLRLSAVIQRIASPIYQEMTEQIGRKFQAAGGGAAGKQAIAKDKRTLPAVTLAGTFARRSACYWQTASGLVQFDLDHLTPEELRTAIEILRDTPWVPCLWRSPSGCGLKGAVRVEGLAVDTEAYATAWKAVTRWLESIGLCNDPSAKDCSRLAFLAHDPEAWYRKDATAFPVHEWQEVAIKPTAKPVPSVTPLPSPGADLQVEERALAYVRAMPTSIEGQNGSAALMAVVRSLRDGFALTGPSLWRCLDTWNQERAVPPWSHQELEHALESVEKEAPVRGQGWLVATKTPNHGHDQDDHDGDAAWASERLLAERLARGPLTRSLRYLPEGPSAGWRSWNGICWEEASDPVPVSLTAGIHAEVAVLLGSQRVDTKTARTLESTASMKAVLAQLQAREPMRLNVREVDPPHLLAVANGILDLKTGQLQLADPDGPCFLRRTAVAYDPDATHPLWIAVADHVSAIPLGSTVQRFLGASLIGLPPDRKLLALVGEGGDGKGTLLRSCVAAMGGFGAVIPAECLSGDGKGAHGHELASPLTTARMAYSSEVPADLDWPLVKSLSGGDPRTSKRMHARAFTVQPRAWLALATNTSPRVPDQAAADRCIIVPWTKPTDPDPEIVAVIASPGPERDAYLRACLRWLVKGARDYLQPRFLRSPA